MRPLASNPRPPRSTTFPAGAIARAALLALAALLGLAAAAQAAVVTDRPLLRVFDGAGSSAGRFDSLDGTIAVDNSTGAVYVGDSDPESPYVDGSASKFNPDGSAWDFSALGGSSLFDIPGHPFGYRIALAVDNSSLNAGRIYAAQSAYREMSAFAPDGTRLWSLSSGLSPEVGDVAVDPSGHPWLIASSGSGTGKVEEYGNTGSPPALLASFLTSPPALGMIDFDAAGNCYIDQAGQIEKYAGCDLASPPIVFASSPPEPSPRQIYVDQSSPTGHVFIVHQGDFSEYSSSGALLGTYGAGYLGTGGAYAQLSIAYSPSSDRVYVGDRGSNVVEVFGPLASGTVPDVTGVTATLSGEEISQARFEGTVNPQGVASAYHFEWRRQGESGWGGAKTSPEVALPVDSNPHTVAFETDELRGNTAYEARLVTVNAADQLRAFSAVAKVTTKKATAAPAVTIDPVTAAPTPPCATGIGTGGACVSGEINPRGDTADWRVQLQRACEGAFTDQPLRTIPHRSAAPVPVSYTLEGLLPSETYCVRIKATNSAGSTAKPEPPEPPVEFTTLPVPPDQVVTAFAAPRTETTARLNAYANPRGETLTYRFEYSKDGGEHWIPLGDHEDTSEARHPILLSSTEALEEQLLEELTGLAPATEYSYRFVAKNAAEPDPVGEPGVTAVVEGGTKAFITRSEAEVKALDPPSCPNEEVRANRGFAHLPQCRGIELVNNPDDGNQNAQVGIGQGTPPLSPDGERALWGVNGGAPGGNSGLGATFLARRSGQSASTPTGWESSSLIPPAAQQVEGDKGSYILGATTPDLSRFLFSAGNSAAGGGGGRTLVRIDENGNQDVLKSYPQPAQDAGTADLSADGAHVLRLELGGSGKAEQLEDIGAARVGPPEVPGEVVSYLPDGTLPECGLSSQGASFVGGGGADFGASPQWRPGYHLIATTDASRVYFQVAPNGECNAAQFTRWWLLERNRETGETLEVAPPDQHNALIRATPDGRSVYFVTKLGLDKRKPDGVHLIDENEHVDVYRWDEETEEGTCLTCEVENEAGETITDANLSVHNDAAVPVMVSDDFSHLYFESTSKLTPQATPGEVNLYTLSGGRLRFVATPGAGIKAVLSRGPGEAELSSDGNVLVFESDAQGLTADRLAAACPDPRHQLGLEPCRELFRYDDRDRSLECLSCLHGATTDITVGSYANANDFSVSADGETVALVTLEALQALAPLDINNGPDLYEWHNGAQRLITDGVGDFGQSAGAALAPAALGAEGRDILFMVTDPGLTGFEQNRLGNLYDARIGGGFEVPPPPEHCWEGSEESCQGPLEPIPPFEQPGSALIEGAGNVEKGKPKPRCARGKVRRHGRCVKRRGRHRKHRGRAAHANRGGAR